MNRPIRRVAVAFMLLFFLLLANANYIQVFQADDLNDREGNRRVLLDEYSIERGAITVGTKGNNETIASSKQTNDRLVYLRQYKKPEMYGLLTGYYSSIYGRSMVERYQNPVLSGTGDDLFVRRMVDLVTNRPPQGGTVQLTIDPKAQEAAYHGLKGKKGAVVALEPKTGRVLAMVSLPSYDPNKLSSHDIKEQERWWWKWNGNPQKGIEPDPNKPMNNRATQFTYPPGSTFKVITAAAALEAGKYEPDTKIPAPAAIKLPLTEKNYLRNWQRKPCLPGGSVTLTQALETSCNTAFAEIGQKLGDKALHDQAQKFGFGTRFLPELWGAASDVPEEMNEPQTMLSAIGQQDVRGTPLQMAMVSAAIANGGEVMQPYIVEKELAPDLDPIGETDPKSFGRAVSPEVAEKLKSMMVSVVENGTGDPAAIPGVEVGGKTGTAQTTKEKDPYAWFISFAPANNPEVAVAVVIEEAEGVERSEIAGGRLAAPIAKSVMRAVLGR